MKEVMTMIIDDIKKAKVDAMKRRDEAAKGILSLLSDRFLNQSIEAKVQGKTLGDVEMIAILMKVGKELEDEKAVYASNGALDRVANIDAQLAVVQTFLPKLLSEAEVRAEISKLSDQSLPSIMKHFKANFSGKVDMGLVNKVAKSL
jgi:uncharacterized protein YqeY